MFRKPREQSTTVLESVLLPSTGRPPTPPSGTPPTLATQKMSASPKSLVPILGRSQTTLRNTGGNRSTPINKLKGKSNGSILNFFKKADTISSAKPVLQEDDVSLFFEDHHSETDRVGPTQTPTPPRDGVEESLESESTRYNEDPRGIKRRRIEEHIVPQATIDGGGMGKPNRLTNASLSPPSGAASYDSLNTSGLVELPTIASSQNEHSARASNDRFAEKTVRGNGPFMEDPDSEDEMIKHLTATAFANAESTKDYSATEESPLRQTKNEVPGPSIADIPSLRREGTSIIGGDGFDGMEDFIDDEFPEDGEEYMERLWMDEQQRLELDLEDEPICDDPRQGAKELDGEMLHIPIAEADDGTESCPICSASFRGIRPEDASIHVNRCLDGEPTPLPQPVAVAKKEIIKNDLGPSAHKRFHRAAIAKPGQDNPFTLGHQHVAGSSAFSRLMSSHAEDTAWANAASAEMAARGRPAYQRICPFYKILPGFFICVDAFRYGAVEGCKAYFLSHFHSDHYIGLTSSWCHGPIYCSHVTANLVRRQLRVDPKWVVDLEFDQKIEVPDTQGVEVTMIPANHCPGSSLYLFEKEIGKGKNPKLQRVLHCGDFRACPAHVQHPLLRPDVVDAVTGKNIRQQKLDVCYLDTTYLTPKYAFPSQEEVIKACADMCISLSKERVDETDDWEQTKKERAGSGMVKFVQKNSEKVKVEADEDDIDAMKVNSKAGVKGRGRLLVIVGTYSIGKERICLGVARALNSKIYAPPNKQKICAALEDPELMARFTNNPLEAQVHMQMLMEIRAETLADYLTGYKPHFSRIVGFRPSGWNYRPPNSRFVESPAVQTVLHSDNWKSRYSMAELVPQRGSTREASCFGVPYSEHSSFRELTMFCCALRIDKIIPTVNVGSAKSREKMKGWCEKWAMEKKKNGLFKVIDGQTVW